MLLQILLTIYNWCSNCFRSSRRTAAAATHSFLTKKLGPGSPLDVVQNEKSISHSPTKKQTILQKEEIMHENINRAYNPA